MLFIRQVPLWPVAAATATAAAGTAVTAVAPVSVLRACGFGERNRVNGAVVSIWFSVSHCQCVRSAATAAVCPKSLTSYFRVRRDSCYSRRSPKYRFATVVDLDRHTVVTYRPPSSAPHDVHTVFSHHLSSPRTGGKKNFKIIRIVRPAIKFSTPITLSPAGYHFPIPMIRADYARWNVLL